MSRGRQAVQSSVQPATADSVQRSPEQQAGPFSARPGVSNSGFAVQHKAASPQAAGPIQLSLRSGASVQLDGGSGSGDVHSAAAQGVSGSGSSLPHKAAIESSFGVDMGNVQAYTGPQAKAACDSMGAQAYAMGDKVAFADSSPSVQLAAHEAAHVVQQAQGVSLSGGVGQAGDKYEVAADAAAARVSSGASAADVLGTSVQKKSAGVQMRAAPGVQLHADAVQMKPKKAISSKAMKRVTAAKEAIKHAKSVFAFGAGNQEEALKETNFNSYFRLKVMRDSSCWDLAPSVRAIASQNREALTAAKADLAHGGNCGEHAQVGYDYLRWKLPGEQIAVSNVTGLDHAFVLMGAYGKDDDADIGVCDPWPTAATACTWEDHFAYTADKSKVNRNSVRTADGKNVKAVIAAGLKLSARGKQMIKMTFDRKRTTEELEKGLGNWIWQHPNAAETEYEYVEAEQDN